MLALEDVLDFRDIGERDIEEQAPLLSFIWGSRRGNSAIYEMQWNLFLEIDMIQQRQNSYIRKQNMIGRESYLYNCVKYRPC